MNLDIELLHLENQITGLQYCKQIVKNIIEIEDEIIEFSINNNSTKYRCISEGLEISIPVICIMQIYLQKIFTNNSIEFETVNKDGKELTYISISFDKINI